MEFIKMPIWTTNPINEEPQIILIDWKIYELDDGCRHFVGYNLRGREGRVSSTIITFDNVAMKGITNSGRIYNLKGESGLNSDADYVWNAWCKIYNITSFKDVSNLI